MRFWWKKMITLNVINPARHDKLWYLLGLCFEISLSPIIGTAWINSTVSVVPCKSAKYCIIKILIIEQFDILNWSSKIYISFHQPVFCRDHLKISYHTKLISVDVYTKIILYYWNIFEIICKSLSRILFKSPIYVVHLSCIFIDLFTDGVH